MERDELLLEDMLIDWYKLFTRTVEFCAFGDNENDEWCAPFDYLAFVNCMKEAYQYFFAEKERPQALTPKEIELYGVIFAYSQLRVITLSGDSDKFEASALAAEEMANTIRDPDYVGLDGSKLIGFVLNDNGEMQKYEYDIKTGDLSDFIKYAAHR